MTLTTISPKKKQPALIKPASGGLLERAIVVGGGIVVLYTTAATLPIASVAAVVGMGVYFIDEIKKFRPKEEGDELQEILSASTPKHPSINDLRAQLKKRYDVAAINRAIEGMLGHTGWIEFSPKDKHPLAKYGEVYCWIDPSDPTNVMLPIQRLEQLLEEWGIEPKDAGPDLPQFQWLQKPQEAPSIVDQPHQPMESPQDVVTEEPVETVAPVPAATQSWDEDPTPIDAHSILMECLAYPCILIYGPQGSGKSTLAKWLISQRLQAGHKIEILDPHAAYGAWPGLAVYGAGMDYQACNQRLLAFADMVRARYTELANRPDYNPKPLTVLTEEFTNWSSHCDAAGDYFASTLSDIRKINMMAVYVAHGRTLASLGGKAGAAAQRDQSLLEIEMLGTIGPGGKAIPSGMCRIYYPGRKNEPIEVAVPQFDPSEMTPPPVLPEVKELILAILEAKGNPMLASEIRQQSNALKKLTTDEVAFALDRMAVDDGKVVSDGGSPARYQIPNDVGHLALDI